ncbi:hypothetical protein DPMN_128698 [Dreissena polymorpha]|uniref:Uncharacterized protein n=2 Tax=Dreissena polymorpha TaxID=45954 RepID=A0A9D4GZZ4_DREPO|nr:hypothetical protein DPMN_128698 [Dreissena polymorpha]
MSSPTILQRILTVILHPIQWITSKFSEPFATEEYTFDDEYHDVYLGGSDGDLLWRAEVAVPLFRKFGLSLWTHHHMTGTRSSYPSMCHCGKSVVCCSM